MLETARKQVATYDDLVALPSNLVGELIDGVLYASPRPAGPHTIVASTLGMELGPPFMQGRGGPGGWWIVDEPELHFEAQVVVPDVAGWRRSRLPVYPQGAFVTMPPDWVCEVLSPSTMALDRVRKMNVYSSQDVGHVWLVDPVARFVEVFHLRDGAYVRESGHADDEVMRAEPFASLEIALAELWLSTEPPPAT